MLLLPTRTVGFGYDVVVVVVTFKRVFSRPADNSATSFRSFRRHHATSGVVHFRLDARVVVAVVAMMIIRRSFARVVVVLLTVVY